MECKHMEEKDQWNEEAGFFQKKKICKHSGKVCQGGEEICSMFEAVPEPKKEKAKEMTEDEEHGKEEAGKEVKEEPEHVG